MDNSNIGYKEASVYTITRYDHLLPVLRYTSNPIYGLELPASTSQAVEQPTTEAFSSPTTINLEIYSILAPKEQHSRAAQSVRSKTDKSVSEHDYETIKERKLPKLNDWCLAGLQVLLVIASVLLIVIPVVGISTTPNSHATTKQDLYAVLLGPLATNTLALLYNFIWQRKENLRSIKYTMGAIFIHMINSAISLIFTNKVIEEVHRLRQRSAITQHIFLLDLGLVITLIVATATSAGVIVKGTQLLVKKAVKRYLRSIWLGKKQNER